MPEKILVVGPSWVGDMIMAQSLFKMLKRFDEQAIIDVVAPLWCQSLLTRMPEVNEGIVSTFQHRELSLAKRYRLGRMLRRQLYDRAIVVPRTFKSALIPFFARIPKRTGLLGEMRYGLINDIRAGAASKDRPMIERYMRLVTDDVPEDPPRPALRIDRQAQHETLKRLGLSSDGNIVGLAPGAEAGPAKRWPARRFVELAEALVERGKTVWLLGSAKERALADEIVRDAKVDQLVNLCGRTTLPEAADLLACCESVVANDSGLMHMAAATGCHVVALYGSSSPRYTPPLTTRQNVIYHALPCSPCFARECPLGHLQCLNGIAVEEVLKCL